MLPQYGGYSGDDDIIKPDMPMSSSYFSVCVIIRELISDNAGHVGTE